MSKFSFLIVLLVCAGCTSFGGPVEEVIERSKSRQPNWIEFAKENSAEDETRITYVSVRTHLQDLPFAVKETQIATLAESEANLRSFVTKKLYGLARDSNIAITNTSGFQSIVRDKVGESHSKHASVTDIYYEKLQGGSSAADFKEFYRIYVRVDYFKRHLSELLKSISSAFKASRHSDLRQLADKMSNSYQQLLGH